MSEQTKIAWCDSTLNFWRGCTKVSEGCANCYAEQNMSVKLHGIKWGKGATRVERLAKARADALRWNKKPWVCDNCHQVFESSRHHYTIEPFQDGSLNCPNIATGYHRRRVFVNSLSDWLDPEVPVEWLASLLDTIRLCPDLTWILVTKRPELFSSRMTEARNYAALEWDTPASEFMHDWLHGGMVGDWSPSNVIVMASVENQARAEERIPALLRIPAICHGLSIEPLLGPVNLTQVRWKTQNDHHGKPQPDHFENVLCGGLISRGSSIPSVGWIVIGGESGVKARPCDTAWIRSLVNQGKQTGVPVFVKQLGANTYFESEAEFPHAFKSERGLLIHPKGGDPSEWPDDLRVREWAIMNFSGKS